MNNDKKQEENETLALNKGDVIARRELLIAFKDFINNDDDAYIHIPDKYIDKFLAINRL